jgi:hypothetical protein
MYAMHRQASQPIYLAYITQLWIDEENESLIGLRIIFTIWDENKVNTCLANGFYFSRSKSVAELDVKQSKLILYVT